MLTLDGAPDIPKDCSSEATRDRSEELSVVAEAYGQGSREGEHPLAVADRRQDVVDQERGSVEDPSPSLDNEQESAIGGEVNSNLVAKTEKHLASSAPGTGVWDAFVERVEATPPEVIRQCLGQLSALWSESTASWTNAQCRIAPPGAWMSAWLAGSDLHGALLDLVPRPPPDGKAPLQRSTYLRVMTYKAHSRFANSIKMVAFYNDEVDARSQMREAAEDYHRQVRRYGLEDVEDIFPRPYDELLLEVFWRGSKVGSVRRSTTLAERPLGEAELAKLVPSVGGRDRLPDRFPDPRLHRARAHLLFELPANILAEFDAGGVSPPEMVPPPRDLDFWDGHLQTGVFTPYELLARLDDCDEVGEPGSWSVARPADFEERYETVILQVCREFGLIPLNPSGTALESRVDLRARCPLPGLESWGEAAWEQLHETPWSPLIARILNWQHFVMMEVPSELPDPLPPASANMWWSGYYHVGIIMRISEGTIRFEPYEGYDLMDDMPPGWVYGVGTAICRRLCELFNKLGADARRAR